MFYLLGNRSVLSLFAPAVSGQVSNVVYQRTARKEEEVGERPKSTAYR